MRRISNDRRAWMGAVVSLFISAGGMVACADDVFAAELPNAPQVPLVGVDKDGRSKAIYIPGEQYLDKLASTLFSVNQAVLPQLNQRVCGQEEYDHFELTSVAVGLGIEFDIGLGAIFSVTTGGKMELIYANQNDPVIIH
jgi:hypothetical protein